MLKTLLLAAALLAGAAAALAALPGEIPVPKLTAHVIDQTGTLTASQRDSLEAKLAEFERTHGSQVVVLMVASTGSEDIFDFATRVTDQWQLGRKGVDDGVLFVIAKDQHDMRIHTGRGVQGTLTDYLSKQIVSDLVAPRFRAGDFAGGIEAGVDAIVKAIEGEKLPLPQASASRGERHSASSYSNLLVLAFFLVPVIGMVLRGVFGRLFGAGIAGGLFGVVAWLFLGSIAFALLAGIFGFVFTIAGGSGLGRGIRGGPPGWGGGFGGGGFGGGGFGGGGFSGGGGTFDGGGASGKW